MNLIRNCVKSGRLGAVDDDTVNSCQGKDHAVLQLAGLQLRAAFAQLKQQRAEAHGNNGLCGAACTILEQHVQQLADDQLYAGVMSCLQKTFD